MAEREIEDVGDRIALDKPKAAIVYVDEMLEFCRFLHQFPLRYRAVGGAKTLRRAPFGSHLVFYRVTPDEVRILHVYHGRRRITRKMLK